MLQHFCIFLLILSPLLGTPMILRNPNPSFQIPDDPTNRMRSKLIRQLCQKYNMEPCGIYDQAFDGIIEAIGADFEINKILSKDEIRKILVDCTEEFLKEMNANKEIRPELKTYPCTAKNVRISIFITDPSREKTYDPNIAVAVILNGTIHYRTNDKDNQFQYKSKTEEPYEEALKLVKKSASKS